MIRRVDAVKMKVPTQGEEVIDHLWDVIAAKGFEKDRYFEMAARDIRALPKREGTVHVNIALIVKFMESYFFRPADLPAIPRRDDANDDFLLAVGEIFTLVVYGQLFLESSELAGIDTDLVDQVFDVLVRDWSRFAIGLHGKPTTTKEQAEHCLAMVRRPAADPERFDRIWQQVLSLRDTYEMSP